MPILRTNLSNFSVILRKIPIFSAPAFGARGFSASYRVARCAQKTRPRERVILADFEKVASFAYFTEFSRSEKIFLC